MITEIELHAFVDGELAEEDRARVIVAAARSPAIRAQLDAFRQIRELLEQSYPQGQTGSSCKLKAGT